MTKFDIAKQAQLGLNGIQINRKIEGVFRVYPLWIVTYLGKLVWFPIIRDVAYFLQKVDATFSRMRPQDFLSQDKSGRTSLNMVGG